MITQQGIYTISTPDIYDPQDFSSKRDLHCKQDPESGSPPPPSSNDNCLQVCGRNMKIRVPLIIDVIVILLVIAVISTIEVGWLPASQGGFYCNDPKISHKYVGDTITVRVLVGITVLVPLLFLFISETFLFEPDLYKSSKTRSRYAVGCARALYRFREYMIGLGALCIIVELAKLTLGEPRPHFLDTCKPDAAVNCTAGFITTYKCTNTLLHPYMVSDSYKSFPSGHSAFSAYTGIFIAWYLHIRYPGNDPWLLRPLLQTVCFLWAFCTPLTRIKDHRHHWWDTLAGFTLGVVCAIYTIHGLCHNFKKPPSKTAVCNDVARENGHIKNGGHHHSIRRLLSTTSSYKEDDKELSDVNTMK